LLFFEPLLGFPFLNQKVCLYKFWDLLSELDPLVYNFGQYNREKSMPNLKRQLIFKRNVDCLELLSVLTKEFIQKLIIVKAPSG